MVKIDLYVRNLSGKGGTEVVVNSLLNMIEKYPTNLSIHLIVSDYMENLSWLSKNVRQSASVRKIKFQNKKIKKLESLGYTFIKMVFSNAEIILCTTPLQIKIAKLVKKIFFKKCKIVSWFHFNLKSDYLDGKEHLIKQADYHLCISQGIKEELIKIGVDEKRVYIINNPVKMVNHRIMNSKDIHFISIGRLSMEKNHIELIEALNKLNKRQFKLSIYGDGDTFPLLEKKVKEYGVEEQVFFKGWIDDPWENISEATALVLTSRYEGFGMVLTEAISRGLPVVSSDCVGPKSIVNGNNGYLYSLGNVEELSQRLLDIANNRERFDKERVVYSILDYYDQYYIENFVNIVKQIALV
ncbi:glycosyltransferase [Enterococcus faecium]|nr:glycosyltransferase [Enterococcus faecium]